MLLLAFLVQLYLDVRRDTGGKEVGCFSSEQHGFVILLILLLRVFLLSPHTTVVER